MSCCEKRTLRICKLYRPRPTCAFRAGLPDPKHFDFCKLAAYQRTQLSDDFFGY